MNALLPLNSVLGLLASLLWGGGDFAGSFAVKRMGSTLRGALQVVVLGHALSLFFLVPLARHAGEVMPSHLNTGIAIAGGVVSGISLMAFYLALSSGHMGSAAAVSGLLCAAVPALFSAVTEGWPGAWKLVGFLLAGGSIWLIAGATGPEHELTDRGAGSENRASSKAMLLSTLGGIGFGIYFTCLHQAGAHGVLWPTAAARVGSAGVCAAVLLALRLRGSSSDRAATSSIFATTTLLWLLGGVVMDTGGNLSFLAAARLGRLDVAAVLAALYPATTILLAALLLGERTSGRQRMGMLLALPAVVLIAR